MTDDSNIKPPNWLENLEKLREKRLQRRLGHETGAGAPCLNCSEKCPGLDLHFWRKICKICKCSKDSHNVEDDDTCGWVQFQLLGTKPQKSKGVLLPGRDLEWTPPGASKAVERYLNDIPQDQIPISGSEAARKRQQRLQNQIPAHDLDASLCDSLTPSEMKQMNEYISHVKQHCVGQGKLVELPIFVGNSHELNTPFAKIVSDQLFAKQVVNSEEVLLKTAAVANDLSNLNLCGKNFNRNEIDNKTNAVHCHECTKLIMPGDIAITADRTNAQWHTSCFICHTCRQYLEDLVYFFDKRSKQIYCGRDYAAIKGIPRCAACDELIFLSEYCLAENQAFHVKHFCCWECDTPLAGEQYLMDGSNPICLQCFKQTKAAKCQQCNLIIGPDENGVQLKDLHWHTPQCFICHQCHKNLAGGKFLLRNQHIYCSGACVALNSS